MIITFKNKLSRQIWNIVYIVFFRTAPSKLFNPWRLFILRLFGAKLHRSSGVYASCKIWAPWNLELGENSWLGPHVNCYNVDKVIIGKNVTISQKAYLCTASHNVYSKEKELIIAPIIIKNESWVFAAAFIGMGVTINTGAIVGATASVYKDVEPWTIVGGNPAKYIKKREIND